jgi:hypothetical protein
MSGVLEFSTSGEYREERLYLLEGTKRQENKLDATLKEVAVAKAELVKVVTDLNRLGGLIRGLQSSNEALTRRLIRMEVKAGSIATLAGVFTAGAIEALRHYLAK